MHKRGKFLKLRLRGYIFFKVIKEKYKFPENHHYENVKILLGIVICSVVALSHYYPLPFPLNYNLIIACIVTYSLFYLKEIWGFFYGNTLDMQFWLQFTHISKEKSKMIALFFLSLISLKSCVFHRKLNFAVSFMISIWWISKISRL